MVGTSMKTYARIQDGLVAELLQTDGDITSLFNPALTWVDVSSQSDIAEGWHFDGTNFTPPPPPPPPAPGPTIAELQTQLAALSAQLAELSGKS
jgi:hypothetical protein